MNVSRLLAGEPVEVRAGQVAGETGVDVRLVAALRFGGGVLGHLDCGFDLPLRHEVEAVGSDGTLRLTPAFARDDGELTLERGGRRERIALPPTHRYALQLENFARACSGDERPLLDRAESVGQARALDALLRSAATGAAVLL